MKKVIVIAGPTASGKTAMSLSVAQEICGEIVSADSMQIYRRMDIGTAKATPEERALLPHHMIDIVEPYEDYSVARYVKDASECCSSILLRGKIPVIVGGTGLYIDSLLSGREFGDQEDDPLLRNTLTQRYDSEGGQAMLNQLAVFDPERASVLHPSEKKRIIRAFEVFLLTGETITSHDMKSRSVPPRYQALYIIPQFINREDLYRRINDRVDSMFSLGLVDEVASLLSEGVPASATAMQAIGYKETAAFLRGESSLEYAVDVIKQGSRRYAKRQITWFGRHTEAFRIFQDSTSAPEEAAKKAADAAKEFIENNE